MSDTIIQVENLGKKYIIGHQQEGRSRYVALRDVMADGARSIWNRLNPLTQNSKLKTQNPTREEFWALKDVSFEVKQGEVIGIIGRNGAGKSTLLKILSRITEPTEGRVKIRGRVASLLEVGTGFHPELTGRENIYLNGAILGMTRAEIQRKFDEIVNFAEVEKFLDTPVKHYSSGMYVRLAFAVAAHLEPEILVVDEVLAVGDAAFQKKCLGKMGDVATKEGRTVLFVSHNMATLQKICQKGFVLDKGRCIFAGSQIEAISEYLSDSTNISNLNGRSDRKGNGKIRIRQIEFLDTQRNILKNIPSGIDIEIRFYYERACEVHIEGLQLSLHLSSRMQENLLMINNRATGSVLSSLKREPYFSCYIKKLPLTAGKYYLSYTIMPDYGLGQEYIDALSNAVEFNVIDGDFYNSGHTISSDFGFFLLDATWS